MIFVFNKIAYFAQSPEEHGPACMFKIVNITTEPIILRKIKQNKNKTKKNPITCLVSIWWENDR